jgi:hypothetical protein
MKRHMLAGGLLVLLAVIALSLTGCGSSSSSSTTNDGGSSTTELSTYAEDVAECSPTYTGTSEDVPGGEENSSITLWAGWDPDEEYSVFWKLIAQSGNESLYGPIEMVDMYIEMINQYSAGWSTDGETEIEYQEGMTATMTVDTTVESVTVPFFTDSEGDPIVQAVNRLITVEADAMNLKMAFTVDGDEEALVVRFERTDSDGTETAVFYATRADDGQIDIKSACYVDYTAQDDYYGAFMWSGNPDAAEPWFALSQFTNAAGGSWILAGGEPDGDMAFLSIRNDDNNVGESGSDEACYLICQLANVGNGDAFTGTIYREETDMSPAALLAANPTWTSLNYIIDGGEDCLGYIDEYVGQSDDLDWVD